MNLPRPENTVETQNSIRRLHQKVVRSRKNVLFSIVRPLAEYPGAPAARPIDVPRLEWIDGSNGTRFLGFGVAAALKASGPKRFRQIERSARRLFAGLKIIGQDSTADIRPRLFGGFSFLPEPDPRSIWASFASGYFVLPRYLITHRAGKSWITFSHLLRPDDDPDDIAWLATSPEISDVGGPVAPQPGTSEPNGWPDARVELHTTQDDWIRSVRDATDRISRRELEKVVLARVLKINNVGRLDPAEALKRLGDKYPSCYRFLFEPISGQAFFGATPELLIRVQGKAFNTDSLAGSIARGASEQEDQKRAAQLMNSPKELHEHDLVVREIQARLAPLSSQLDIPAAPRIRKLRNIQHLETPIRGTLLEPTGVLPLAEELHATPAVGGSPRSAALKLISKYESFSRGWYAAPIGWIDSNLDGMFAVAIRSALHAGAELRLFAGAGIVAGSDPLEEWEETSLKFRPVLDALRED